MKWRRIFATTFGISLLVAGTMAAPLVMHAVDAYRQWRANQPAPLPATPTEQTQILDALFRSKSFGGPHPYEVTTSHPIVLLSDTVSFCSSQEANKLESHGCHFFSANHFEDLHYYVEVPKKLLDELVLGNQSNRNLSFLSRPDVIVRDRAFVQGKLLRPESGWWENFYREFPNSSGYIEVSQAVFSPDRDSALIYVGHYCGGLCGSGALYLLQYKSGAWHVSSESGLWVI